MTTIRTAPPTYLRAVGWLATMFPAILGLAVLAAANGTARPAVAEGERWVELALGPGTVPSARSAAYDTKRNRILTVGGDASLELWSLDLDKGNETWRQLRPEGARSLRPGQIVFDPAGDQLVMITAVGVNGAAYAMRLAEGDGTWRRLASMPPALATISLDGTWMYQSMDAPGGQTRRAIYFGGRSSSSGKLTNTMWALDLTPGAETWSEVRPSGTVPEPRANAATVYDEANHRMLVFGGMDTNGFTIDEHGAIWALDLSPGAERWSRLEPAGSEAIEFPVAMSAVIDPCPATRQVLYFGGAAARSTGRYVNTTLSLSLSEPGKEAWRTLDTGATKPRARYSHLAAFDSINRRMVIALGVDRTTVFDDAWALELVPCDVPLPTSTSTTGTTVPPPTVQPTPTPSAPRTPDTSPTAPPPSTEPATATGTAPPLASTTAPPTVPARTDTATVPPRRWIIWLPVAKRE